MIFLKLSKQPGRPLITAARNVGGGLSGWEAFDLARVVGGIPRFGVDMTEKNLAPEAGLEKRAISYNKGCYIGQEVLNRLRTFAEVNRRLCRLKILGNEESSAAVGRAIFRDQKDVGTITSACRVPGGTGVALGYVRKDSLDPGNEFALENGIRLQLLETVD